MEDKESFPVTFPTLAESNSLHTSFVQNMQNMQNVPETEIECFAAAQTLAQARAGLLDRVRTRSSPDLPSLQNSSLIEQNKDNCAQLDVFRPPSPTFHIGELESIFCNPPCKIHPRKMQPILPYTMKKCTSAPSLPELQAFPMIQTNYQRNPMQFPISTHVPLHNSMMFSMNPALSEPNLITFAQMQQNNLQACLSQMNHVSKKSSKKSSDLLKEDKKKVYREKNRESARASRRRKKQYFEMLQARADDMRQKAQQQRCLHLQKGVQKILQDQIQLLETNRMNSKFHEPSFPTESLIDPSDKKGLFSGCTIQYQMSTIAQYKRKVAELLFDNLDNLIISSGSKILLWKLFEIDSNSLIHGIQTNSTTANYASTNKTSPNSLSSLWNSLISELCTTEEQKIQFLRSISNLRLLPSNQSQFLKTHEVICHLRQLRSSLLQSAKKNHNNGFSVRSILSPQQRLKLIDWLNRNRSQVVIASLESSAMASTAMLHAGLQSTPLTANSFSSSSFSSNSSNSVSGAPTALNCVPQFSNSIPSISLLSPFTAVTGAFGGREETLSQLQQLLAASGLTSETKPEIQAQILSIPNKPQGTTLKRSIRSLNTDFDVDSHMDGDAKKQKT